MRLVVTTYEGKDRHPVLTHIFHGRTRADVLAVVQAHARTDSFFNAAVTTQNFRGIPLRSTWRWGR